MRVQLKNLSDKERVETLDMLYTAAGNIRGRDAAKKFLRDLLTENERIMLGRRILIARLLLSGHTYDQIVEKMHVGKDTIERIAHWLRDQMPGYEDIIKKAEKELDERSATYKDKKRFASSALYRLKKRYPLHFLLFPTPKE